MTGIGQTPSEVRDRALRMLGPMLPTARQWFTAELALGTSPKDAAEAIGFVLAHAAAGVAAATPNIERQVVDWLTWEARKAALEILARAQPAGGRP